MSLYDALGAIGTGLRVAGGGLSPQAFGIQAQQDENEKSRNEQKKRFLAELLTQHYQQGTLDPLAYQQAMGKLGINLPPIQAQPDYASGTTQISQQLDNGAFMPQSNPGMRPQETPGLTPVTPQDTPQDAPIVKAGPSDDRAPNVDVVAPPKSVYGTEEINTAVGKYADWIKSQPGTQAQKAKAVKEYRQSLFTERSSQLKDRDMESLIKNRESEMRAREREKDTPFLREFKAWQKYDHEADPVGYQLLTDRVSRDANGNKTAVRKNIEAEMTAKGLREGTEDWDEGLAKGMRDYFESKKKPGSDATKLTQEALGPLAWKSLLFGKNPPGMGNASASQRAEVSNKAAEIGHKLGLTDAEIAVLPENNKVKMKAADKLTTWGSFVDVASERLTKTIDVAIDYAKKLGPDKVKRLNQAIIAGEREFNDPIANAYAVQVNIVRQDYGRLVTGPTSNAMLPVEAIKKGDELVSTGFDVPTWQEVKKSLLRDAQITRDSVSDQKNALLDGIKDPTKKAPVDSTWTDADEKRLQELEKKHGN